MLLTIEPVALSSQALGRSSLPFYSIWVSQECLIQSEAGKGKEAPLMLKLPLSGEFRYFLNFAIP